MMMDVVRGEHRDPAMAMLGVVPREERPAEGDRGGDVVEAAGEAGMVLQGLELRLGERVVVGHLGAAQRAGHAEIASSCAVHLLVIGAPRSECSVSTRGWTSCLWQVSSMRRPASTEFSRSATIQPTA